MKSIEQQYRRLTDVEHCLARPGRYIGAVKPHTSETWIVNQTDHKMVKNTITWNPGLIKLFDEVISNAVDHSKRPEGKNLDTIKVEINRDTGEISVLDNGGIPVVEHKEYNEYIPTLIFGYLRSGSNFDDTEDSTGTGQNGEGASLTNIFSTSFTVETCDGTKKFKQTWTKNMMEKTTPKISNGDHGFTKITFIPDYAHLGTQLDDGNYAKIIKRVYDIAGCNPTMKVYLNGSRIQIKSFKDYVSMYVTEFEYDENQNWQVAIAHSDEGFQHVSFVNTTETVIGGSHVRHVSLQICNMLREAIQKKFKIDVKPAEIQSHIRVFINATVVRPRYDSQTKENLITEVKEFKTSWEASDKLIARIMKSHIIQSVLDWVEAKAKAQELARLRELNKDVEKANVKRIDKFSDALESTKRHLCELYLTEGDSARVSIHEARGKNPYIASFALKGKPLNITDSDVSDILKNNEIKNILKIVGLKIGEPVKTVKDLRFGKIVILSDQDLDGFHISSLLMNLFAYFWPELFELGVIYRMNTPLVIAELKGKDDINFLTDDDYEEWAKKGIRHEARRFKGLGSFTIPRFKKIIEKREQFLVRLNPIKTEDKDGLALAFSGSMADERKDWLSGVSYFDKFDE